MKRHFPTLLVGLLGFLVAGCSALPRPVPSTDFGTAWTVQEETRSQSEGMLFFTDYGLWGFEITRSGDYDHRFTAGDFILWTGESPHLFGVVGKTRKGYWLQRLDTEEFKPSQRGYFELLSAESIARRWDSLCLLSSGESLEEHCGHGPRFQQYLLYSLSDDERRGFPDRREPGMPFRPDGLFQRQGDLFSFEGTNREDLQRIAIPVNRPGATLLATRIVYDEQCFQPQELPSQGRSRVDWIPAEESISSTATHPLEVEAEAWKFGADLLLRCGVEGPELLIPLLSRPGLRDERRILSLPALGLVPRPFPGNDATRITQYARAAAAVAVGDIQTATFWLQKSMPDLRVLESNAERDFLLSTMSLYVAAGQPEQAHRLGRVLTARSWSPEHHLDFLDAQVLLYQAFSDQTAARERMQLRERLVRQHNDSFRKGFYLFSQLRLSLYSRPGVYGPAFDSMIATLEEEDEEAWALSAWAILAMEDVTLPRVEDPVLLVPRFEVQQAASFWRAITLLDGDLQYIDAIRPHSYRFSAAQLSLEPKVTLEEILLRPATSFRQGYRLEVLLSAMEDLDPEFRAVYLLTALPLAPRNEQGEVVKAMLEVLRTSFGADSEAFCSEIEGWQSGLLAAFQKADAPVLPPNQRQWLSFLSWSANEGFPGLCAGPRDLMEAMEKKSSPANPWVRLLLPFLEDQLFRQTQNTDFLEDISRAARLSRRLQDPVACTTWNLGVSVGLARQGYLDEAKGHLVHATNCLGDDRDLQRARALVEAYVEFERGAGRSVIRDGGIERTLNEATKKAASEGDCLGVLPIGFQLENHLPRGITRIADGIAIAPRPHSDRLLQTASSLMVEAQAAYLSGLRDLQRGQFRTAAQALHTAHEDFRRLQHLPGLARIQFLDHHLFGEELAEHATDRSHELAPLSGRLAELRRGQFSSPPTQMPGINLTEEDLLLAIIFREETDLRFDHLRLRSLAPLLCSLQEQGFYMASDEEYDEDSIEIIRGTISPPRDINLD